MIIFRNYDKENRIDRVWYNSSSIIYSECDDKENSLKTLRVTFKGGSTYEYKDVDANDYIMFIAGGQDGSNGKSLNKFIKAKCEYRKLPDIDLQKLNESLLYYQNQTEPLEEKH